MVRPRKATSTAGAQQPKLPPTSPEEAAALRHDLTATLERLRPADARSRLGLPAGADRRSIKKAFLALSRQYHPDVFARHADAALSQLAEEVYLLISAAENELHKESKGGQGSTAPNHSGEIRSGRSTAPYPPVAGEPGGAAGPQRGNPRAADVEMTGAPPRRRSGTLPHAPTAGTGGASLRPAGRSTRPWTEGDPRGPAQGPPRLRRRQSEGARQTSPWGAEPAPPRGTAPRDPSRPGADQTGPFRAQRHDSSGDRHEPTADQTGPFRVPPAGAVHPGRRRWTSPAHGMPRVRYSDDAASLPLESSPGPLGRGGGDARQAEPHEAGFVALDEGRYRDARNLFSLAVKLSPNNVSYRAALELARGYLLKERGSLDEAAEHFQRALTHDPKSVRAKKELHEHAKRSEASGGFFSRLFKR